MVVAGAAGVTLPAPGQPVIIADYGSSQGHNSLAPMRAVIATLRQRSSPATPIGIVHTDLPSNDFSALFTLLAESPDSYLRGAAEVYPSAIGRSFYQPLFPTPHLPLRSSP